MAAGLPGPDPTVPAAPPPNTGEARALLDAFRKGQDALAALTSHLDPRAVYSEDVDPRPIWVFSRSAGEWREVKPFSFLKLSDPGATAPPAAPAGKGV